MVYAIILLNSSIIHVIQKVAIIPMPASESKSKMLHIMQYDLVTENAKCYGGWKACLAGKCVMFFHHQRWI